VQSHKKHLAICFQRFFVLYYKVNIKKHKNLKILQGHISAIISITSGMFKNTLYFQESYLSPFEKLYL